MFCTGCSSAIAERASAPRSTFQTYATFYGGRRVSTSFSNVFIPKRWHWWVGTLWIISFKRGCLFYSTAIYSCRTDEDLERALRLSEADIVNTSLGFDVAGAFASGSSLSSEEDAIQRAIQLSLQSVASPPKVPKPKGLLINLCQRITKNSNVN